MQKEAFRAASQRAKHCVFSVQEQAGRLRESIRENVQEETWKERENGTVFVMPETPRNSWVYLKDIDPETSTLGSMSELHDEDLTTLESSSEDTLSRDLERVSLGSLGKWTWDIHSIILDLSSANFIDTVAIKTLTNVGEILI